MIDWNENKLVQRRTTRVGAGLVLSRVAVYMAMAQTRRFQPEAGINDSGYNGYSH